MFKKILLSIFFMSSVMFATTLDDAYSYNEIGMKYYQNGDYKNALINFQKVLSICEEILGKEHSDTIASYNNIGSVYKTIKNYPKALEFYIKALNVEEKVLGKEHPDTVTSYNNIGSVYSDIGDYPKALGFYTKALDIREKVLGKEHASTAISYSNLGYVYSSMGNYPKALEFYARALSIQEKVLGKETPNTATSYGNMGYVYSSIGNYIKALEFYTKDLNIKEKILGKSHPDTAITYNNMGSIYKDIGDYSKALEFYVKALSIQEKVLGKEHPDTATSYNNIGSVYSDIGDYPNALEFYVKALNICEKVLGREHSRTAASYNNIGLIYKAIRDYPKALEFHIKALNIKEKVLGKSHPDTATSYNNIGLTYKAMRDYFRALEFYAKALSIQEKVLGKEHPDTATSYNNIGSVYSDIGDYPKALEFYTKALNIEEKVLGKEHPGTSIGYNNLGSAYQHIGNYLRAYNYLKKSYFIYKLSRNKNFDILSNEQKKKFLEANSGYLPNFLVSAFEYQKTLSDKQPIKREIYEIFINDKGMLLDDENTVAMLKNISKDKNLISKIDNLNTLKRAYAKLSGATPKSEEAKSYQEKLKKISDDIDKTEIEIAGMSSKFKEELGIRELKLNDLTKYLKPNELFIDFGYYREIYYAFSIDKNGEVEFTMLNSEDSKAVDKTIKEFRADIDKIINSKDANSDEALKLLYDIVVSKGIGSRIYKFDSLIVSADGALRLLPFETLRNNGKYLIETKQIRYTPSAKEFIRTHKFNSTDAGKDITMFSDPNYESKSGKTTQILSDTPNTNEAVQTRSIRNMGTFKRLRGFKKEEEVLQSLFGDIKLFSRENANEENMLAVKSPKILHITTHGYFISDENITNPMLKSGVALSGANVGIKQQTGEGLMNALKLSGLSLEGTDLVVLSACETGVVDAKDTSSVASLPKTFIQAGSKNVLMSLWSVDDNSTVELMKEFYADTKGNGKFNEVLREAKLKMIKDAKHPFYWAAFIMSGE